MGDILNNLTREQLSAIQEKALSKRSPRNCAYCEKELLMRRDQHFCTPKCRSAYSRAAAAYAAEELIRADAAHRAERDELIRELAAVRAELAALKFPRIMI